MKGSKFLTLIIGTGILTVASIGITINSINHNKKSLSTPTTKAQLLDSSKKIGNIEIKEAVEININTALPDASAFTNVEATVIYPKEIYKEIYRNNQDQEVTKEEAVENEILKEEYTKELIATKAGHFVVTINIYDDKYKSIIYVTDDKKPELSLKELTITESDNYTIDNFITSCTDNSNETCTYSYKEDKMGTYTSPGTYDIIIVAKDSSNNKTESSTKLTINKKEEPKPVTPTNPQTPTTPSNPSTPTTPTTPTNPDPPVTPDQPVTPDPPVTPEPTTPSVYVPSSQEISNTIATGQQYYGTLLTLTNQYRAEVGASPLTNSDYLNRVATLRAIEIAKNNYFSHTRPDGRSWSTAYGDIGSHSFSIIGENLAAYQTTPTQAMEEWKASQGHYENIINSQYRYIGFGVIKYEGKWYWVQAFGG